MGAYHPESRRPISDLFRRTATAAVGFCVRNGIHPDLISYLSIVSSAGSAACFWLAGRHPLLLLLGPVLCHLRLWLNMLDGMVALSSGKASPKGELVNDLPDRVSDILIFVGVAHSGWVHPVAGYWAAILALLTAYVGTLGQAVGGRREFGGMMSKPWRMVLLTAGAWTTCGLLEAGNGGFRFADCSILDWTCFLIIAGCFETIAVRLARTVRLLGQKGQTIG
jgi:phosphatidylglycerophosphate synthase